MFTGIVREIGHVREITHSGDTKIRISCRRTPETIDIGASIACSGVCLTVVARGEDESGPWFSVDASAETRGKTNVGDWTVGSPVNLEPALKVGDELGGHIVSGHVDGVGELVAVTPEGDSHRMTFAAPTGLGLSISDHQVQQLVAMASTVGDGLGTRPQCPFSRRKDTPPRVTNLVAQVEQRTRLF